MSIVPPKFAPRNKHATLVESFQVILDHVEGLIHECQAETRRLDDLLETRQRLLAELANAEAAHDEAHPVAYRIACNGVDVLLSDGDEVHLPDRDEVDMQAMGLERAPF